MLLLLLLLFFIFAEEFFADRRDVAAQFPVVVSAVVVIRELAFVRRVFVVFPHYPLWPSVAPQSVIRAPAADVVVVVPRRLATVHAVVSFGHFFLMNSNSNEALR